MPQARARTRSAEAARRRRERAARRRGSRMGPPAPAPEGSKTREAGDIARALSTLVNQEYKWFIIKVSLETGLSLRVIAAWVLAEGGPTDNPLNIGPGNNYGSEQAAAAATVKLLNGSLYRGIMASAGKSDMEQIDAIVASPWCPNCSGYKELLLGTYERAAVVGPGSADPRNMGIGGGITGAAEDVVNSIGDAIPNPIADIVKFIARLFEPSFWVRVGKVVLGAVVLVIGITVLGRAMLGIDLGPGERTAKAYKRVRGYDEGLERQAEADKRGYDKQSLREAEKSGAERRRREAKTKRTEAQDNPNIPF